jgi:hypothetical protein
MAMTIRTAVASRRKGKDMFNCEDMFEGMFEGMGKSGFE